MSTGKPEFASPTLPFSEAITSGKRVRLQGSWECPEPDWTIFFPRPDTISPEGVDQAVLARFREYHGEICAWSGMEKREAEWCVSELAIRFFAIDESYRRASTVALRRKRVQKLIAEVRASNARLRCAAGLLSDMHLDDPTFTESVTGQSAILALRANALAEFYLDRAAQSFGPPSKGDNRRSIETPIRWFDRAAGAIWSLHAIGAPKHLFRQWRELLFEVITGEEGRSFEKLDRSRRKKTRSVPKIGRKPPIAPM